MTHVDTNIVGGVDTHKDSHTVAALSEAGRLLGTAQFAASPDGYQDLLGWLRGFGPLVRVGVEGTGSYGAGLFAYLRQAGVEIREGIRPKRQVRRRRGKSDPVDAEAAARAVLAGDDLGTPKRQDGSVEALRSLRLTRRSALKHGPRRPINSMQSFRPRRAPCGSNSALCVWLMWSHASVASGAPPQRPR